MRPDNSTGQPCIASLPPQAPVENVCDKSKLTLISACGLQACAQMCSLRAAAGLSPELPTILIGFSKGGVVLNQVSVVFHTAKTWSHVSASVLRTRKLSCTCLNAGFALRTNHLFPDGMDSRVSS